MVYIELIVGSQGEHRRGWSFAFQGHDLDSAYGYLVAMCHTLPPNYRPELPPFPSSSNLRDELQIKKAKYDWVIKNIALVEDHISRWIYSNRNLMIQA